MGYLEVSRHDHVHRKHEIKKKKFVYEVVMV
jgi:hypothetical protein